MTNDIRLFIGNRQSGKTRNLLYQLKLNCFEYDNLNIFYTLNKNDFITYYIYNDPFLLNFWNSGKIQVQRYREDLSPSLSNRSNYFLYLDEFDHIKPRYKISFRNEIDMHISIGAIKKLYAACTPSDLRDSRDLNVNHISSSDLLIYLLQLTDYNFDYLFNAQIADYFLKNNQAKHAFSERIFLTEGFGAISKFD